MKISIYAVSKTEKAVYYDNGEQGIGSDCAKF